MDSGSLPLSTCHFHKQYRRDWGRRWEGGHKVEGGAVVLALLVCQLPVKCPFQFMSGEEASRLYYQAVMKQTSKKWTFL